MNKFSAVKGKFKKCFFDRYQRKSCLTKIGIFLLLMLFFVLFLRDDRKEVNVSFEDIKHSIAEQTGLEVIELKEESKDDALYSWLVVKIRVSSSGKIIKIPLERESTDNGVDLIINYERITPYNLQKVSQNKLSSFRVQIVNDKNHGVYRVSFLKINENSILVTYENFTIWYIWLAIVGIVLIIGIFKIHA